MASTLDTQLKLLTEVVHFFFFDSSFYLERISVFGQPMALPSCSGFASFVYLLTLVGVGQGRPWRRPAQVHED